MNLLRITNLVGEVIQILPNTIVGYGFHPESKKSFVVWAGGNITTITTEPILSLEKRVLAALKVRLTKPKRK